MTVSKRVKGNVVLGIGFLLMIFGVMLGVYIFPAVVHDVILKNARLEESSKTWSLWTDIPFPIYMKFYMFNVTNADNVEKFGEKPIVEEIGPYVYEEKRIKWNITKDGIDTVTYLQNWTWSYREDLTYPLSDQDIIIGLNAPLVGALEALTSKSVNEDLLNIIVRSKNVFIKHTVDEFLFSGMPLNLPNILPTLPPPLDDGKFGYFEVRNGSNDGVYTVNTGISDYRKFGDIELWNGEPSIDFWNGTYCNMINGTDGTIYPPFITKKSVLEMYATDLCRSLKLVYEKDIEFSGVPGYRFVVPDILLADPLENPDNLCFCPASGCLKAGALDLSSCQHGAPIIVSLPHFYQGAEEYVNGIEGLTPTKEKHETFLDMEPTTGVPMQASKRIQLNMFLKKYNGILPFKNVPEALFPLFWAEESASLDEKTANLLRTAIVVGFAVMQGIQWFLIGAGVIMMCVGIYLICNGTSSQMKFNEEPKVQTQYVFESSEKDSELPSPEK